MVRLGASGPHSGSFERAVVFAGPLSGAFGGAAPRLSIQALTDFEDYLEVHGT